MSLEGFCHVGRAFSLQEKAVDRRISVLARAIELGATVYNLEMVKFCDAPPFGSPPRTVRRIPASYWSFARSWLYVHLTAVGALDVGGPGREDRGRMVGR
jgi:hypothetical protein